MKKPKFKLGERVVVIKGMMKFQKGEISEMTKTPFFPTFNYMIDFENCMSVSWIKEKHLRKLKND